MTYKIRKFSRNGIMYVEEFEVPEFTCFYKFNDFEDLGHKYATYVTLLPYSKKDYLRLNRLDRIFIYVLFPLNKMLLVLKDYEFVSPEPYTLLDPFKIDPMYLECTRNVNNVSESKEMYHLLEFTGYGFDVIKVTFKDPILNQEHPSISREIIDLPTLFRDQKNIKLMEADTLCTDFISEDVFERFKSFVLSLIYYNGKSTDTTNSSNT